MMQLVTLREPLDCENLLSFGGERQCEARDHPPAIDQHRAGTALPVVTTFLGANETDVLAQRIEHGGP